MNDTFNGNMHKYVQKDLFHVNVTHGIIKLIYVCTHMVVVLHDIAR